MHDDKGETPGPTNGDMMRQAMWAMGPEVSTTIFNEEIVKIRAKHAEQALLRAAAERARKLSQLDGAIQLVASLKHELSVYTCNVCGDIIDVGQTCHEPPP